MPGTRLTRYLRTPISLQPGDAPPVLDREARVVRDVAVVSVGEAKGHGFWIDEEFIAQVAEKASVRKGGLKSRYTHPGLSSDGLGKYLGRVKDLRAESGVARGTLHVSPVADRSPDGELGAYVLEMVEEDPEALGLSIVFRPDPEATDAFRAAHLDDEGRFVSPDPRNQHNLPHVRLASIHAVDVVDEPAANAHGMFGDGEEMATRAEQVIAWALGVSDEIPDEFATGGWPAEKIRATVRGFLDYRGLEVRPKAPEVTLDFGSIGAAANAAAGAVGAVGEALADAAVASAVVELAEAVSAAGEVAGAEDSAVALGAIPYGKAHPGGTPRAPQDERWDAPAQRKAAGVDDLKVMAAWVDDERADTKGAYKFIHHRAGDGHAVVLRALRAALARLPGSDIPDGDKAGVRMHIVRHLREFGESPPEEQNSVAWAQYEAWAATAPVWDRPALLRALGFSEEAAAFDADFSDELLVGCMADDEGADDDSVIEFAHVAVGEVDDGGLSADDLRDIVEIMDGTICRRLAEVTGRIAI